MGSSLKGGLAVKEGLSKFGVPVKEEQEEEASAQRQDRHYDVALEGGRLQANKLVDLSCLFSLVDVLVLHLMGTLIERWAQRLVKERVLI